MYVGEVNIAQDELNSFLTVAEDLKVKGLTQGNAGDHEKPKSKRQEAESGSISKPNKSYTKAYSLHPQQQVANHPLPALSQAQVTNISKYHQQVEEEEIQEIVPVKSEPHENSQQLSNVTESAVALGESYSELESYDHQFEETEYENGASNMQYVGDYTGKGENNLL